MENEAKLAITWNGSYGELVDPVNSESSDVDIKRFAAEAVRNGSVDGIPADANADFGDFVVDRFSATANRMALVSVRPKTPFGY